MVKILYTELLIFIKWWEVKKNAQKPLERERERERFIVSDVVHEQVLLTLLTLHKTIIHC